MKSAIAIAIGLAVFGGLMVAADPNPKNVIVFQQEG